ncbi:MAG: General secretion pathway protein K [Planctomycetes bacterium ADurb.Bin126]|nr:MAG: General secretion pathway protein K [Planctomycetes bacterium ADurb.Bin126]HOD81790.1 type II secretion system protein GspK [Phycisphaerae bacterium]HQL75566.1 type II secretion system protein GspK [Phycisphaerae bacterium]
MRPPRAYPGRRGTILIVTMWIILALVAVTLVMAHAARTEIFISANELALLQARAVEQGAIQYVLSRVASLQGQMPDETQTECEAVPVGLGAFWILKPDFEDDSRVNFGIVDEASKVNLNTAPASQLALLGEMDSELAAAIVDWRDEDETVTTGGAESEYYLLLGDPYPCKNSTLETVDELLLIRDFDTEILYREDVNRNGMLDANENDADATAPSDNRDGKLDRGLAPFVTVYSREPNRAADGEQRANVNQENNSTLSTLLNKHLSSARAAEVLGRARTARPFTSVLDFIVRMELTSDEANAVSDYLTTSSQTTLRGLINVNTASSEVLATLPGLDESDVNALLSARASNDAGTITIGWIAQALKPDKAAAIGPLITGRAYRFSADIVSLAPSGRAFRRCFIIVDAQKSVPRVVYRQDLTHLGWPLEPEILAAVRAGASLESLRPSHTLGEATP